MDAREINIAIEQNRFAGFVLPPVLPIILYHGERPFTAPIRLSELVYQLKGFEKYLPDFGLFKLSVQAIFFGILLLADSGYQGLLKLHKNSRIPFKKAKIIR